MRGRPLYELKYILYSDGRLTFNDFEDLLFYPYISYRIWNASISSDSVKYFCLLEFVVSRKEITIWQSPVKTYIRRVLLAHYASPLIQ